jgi:DNA primase
MYNILDLLKQDGFDPHWVATTNDGEYASPCPFCGGEDRFRSWPKEGTGGKWWCRQCTKSGDRIQYLRDFKNMSYAEACRYLKVQQRYNASDINYLDSTTLLHYTPRKTEPPPLKWQKIMQGVVGESKERLKSTRFKYVWNWLRKTRGLQPETIETHSLGWNDVSLSREFSDQDGQVSKIWISEGLTIPCYRDGIIQKVNVRRSARGDLNKLPEDGKRYRMATGSCGRANMVFGESKDNAIVVESDLDAILLYQIAGDIVTVAAMGSAANKPDYQVTKILSKAKSFLVSLDNDDAGINATYDWWLSYFPNAKRWPVPKGKDPGEAYQVDEDLRIWIRAGLPDDVICIEDLIEPCSEQFSIEDILNE